MGQYFCWFSCSDDQRKYNLKLFLCRSCHSCHSFLLKDTREAKSELPCLFRGTLHQAPYCLSSGFDKSNI